MIEIGPYVAGEIPEPLEYQFLDADGEPINITGYTPTLRLQYGAAVGVEKSAALSTPLEGKVTYTWVTNDLAAGRLSVEFWITNGTNKFASDLIRAEIRAAIPIA